MNIPSSQEVIQQQKFENSVVVGSIALGGTLGYKIGSRLFEGKTLAGKTVELGIKAGSILIGGTVGLVTATYALLAKQELEDLRNRAL